VQGFDLAQDRDKKTGQDRTDKKLQNVIFHLYLGRNRHWTDYNLQSSQ